MTTENQGRALRIGKGEDGFALPLELVTSTQAILARKRSGKSYTASVQAEELLEAGQQIVVIDPTGAWWGLRSSSDGEGPGYAVAAFGGDHGDAPLDFRAGKAMAAAVVEHGFSAIFDVSTLPTEEQVEFVKDFASELLRINRAPIHLFVDEADTFAPQKPLGPMQNKCLGTVSRLVKQGGKGGTGFTMITQRPASMNKDVLSQVDILTVLRMSHPLDVKATSDWIKSEVSPEFAREVETALPSLPVGTAFVCSAPLSIGKRVEVRARRTFNSGATPKPGERRAEPKVLAAVDIARLGKEIAASVEKVKAESPEYLQRRVAELEATLKDADAKIKDAEHRTGADMGFIEEAQAQQAELERLRVERDDLSAKKFATEEKARALAERLRSRMAAYDEIRMSLASLVDHLYDMAEVYNGEDEAEEASGGTPTPLDVQTPRFEPPPKRIVNVDAAPPVTSRDALLASQTAISAINAPQQRILDSMATLYSIRGANVTLEWIAATSGTTARARGFEENMRRLKALGLVEGARLTGTGRALASAIATPANDKSVVGRLSSMLSAPQTNILLKLKAGRSTPSDLAAHLGTTERARGFEENIRTLRNRGLILYAQGTYKLAAWLEALA